MSTRWIILSLFVVAGFSSPVRGDEETPVRGDEETRPLSTSIHVGLGPETGYGGPVLSTAVRRELAGTGAARYWVGAKADFLDSGRLVLGPCPCTVKTLEYASIASSIGISLPIRPLAYDLGFGAHLTHIDWRRTDRATGVEEESTGWYGGFHMVVGSAIRLGDRWNLRGDLGLSLLSVDPRAVAPLTISLAYRLP